MLTDEQRVEAGQRLLEAEETRIQTGLISIAHPDATMDDAYAIQAELVRQKIAAGRRITGWKIGLTSKAMQAALNITTPDSGILFDDMYFASGATVPKGRFIQPRIEAEIAFVMKSDLDHSNLSEEAILEATDYVCPSLEILDTRILRKDPSTGTTRNIVDTISDNAANAGYVLGTHQLDPKTTDLRWMGAIVSRNGEVEETGLGAGVLNNPVTSMLWLAERLASYGGQIKAGQVILSGSFIRPIEAVPGSHVHADFGPYGIVDCCFE
jgi:2-oxo-hept-3-ene-1,7-dioate hydratase